ncbi:hypothetical protein [Novosphingobium sp.]|uniref:hypothetical protein n=1 Tax=Novosphingobium sp. TaxID=1874826 RepID=UPI002FE1EBD2
MPMPRSFVLPALAGAAVLAGLSVQADAASSSLARPDPTQVQGLERALASAPAALKADVAAAMPTLRPFAVTLMCVQDDRATQGLVARFVGSRGTAMFNGWAGANSPGKRIRSHDMVGCLSVTRIQNWKRVAANEFKFDILFTAEDSGESYLWNTVVHKEPDGTWLIA